MQHSIVLNYEVILNQISSQHSRLKLKEQQNRLSRPLHPKASAACENTHVYFRYGCTKICAMRQNEKLLVRTHPTSRDCATLGNLRLPSTKNWTPAKDVWSITSHKSWMSLIAFMRSRSQSLLRAWLLSSFNISTSSLKSSSVLSTIWSWKMSWTWSGSFKLTI